MTDHQKHPLISRLEALADESAPDRGKLATLRRAIQDPIEAYPIVLPFLRVNVSNSELDRYALLAALFALHPKSGDTGNMGVHMRQAAGDSVEATERRFVNLLRSSLDDLPFLLRQSVSFIRSRDGVVINWEQLRKDLLYWDHPDRFVQKNWARGFWGYQPESKEEHDPNQQNKEN
ncbi:MAG: type I-E CRISPR-associated protein Cse2/CasB [Anaerolineaceae bacterium]|jgi:CRISPR system Cascade subunit CasB|nr:type I-E CRISPR-associated protein Cse2/CasB [Anaerolineaceae bacterium]